MLVQAKCPGCGTVLRVPSEWINKSIRCKSCGKVVRTEKNPAASSSSTRKAKAARPAKNEPGNGEFAFTAVATSAGRRSSRLPNTRYAIAGVAALAVIGIAVYFLTPAPAPEEAGAQATTKAAAQSAGQRELPVATGPFPRRLLAIQVCNYLYFDPIGYGKKPTDGHGLVERLSQFLHVQPNQVAELSDAAPGNAKPPMKRVIEKTITDFLKASRKQDRVVVLFAGHVIEVEDQPYLVPMEGESGDKNSLIPLAWVYEQLSNNPGRQKLLILDVCPLDPSRGTLRQGSGPMGEKTFAALQKPPTGIQVWSACSAGQYSYEDGLVLQGSVFLTKIAEALAPGKEAGRAGIQKPEDPLPVATIGSAVTAATQREVETIFRQKQTPVLAGETLARADPGYDPQEPFPPKLAIDWRPTKDFKAAPQNLIQGILKEAAEIPPVKVPPAGAQTLRADLFPFFSEANLKGYQPDNGNTPLRDAIKKAMAVLKKHAQTFPEVFKGDIAALKKQVAADQHRLAAASLELNEALEFLEAAGKERDKENSKRWRAYYDYVHARLLERIAYTFEYNYVVAGIRTDSLPERDPKRHNGWRLASRDKMQAKGDEGKQAKKFADDAKQILMKMAEENRGTPWEILAKRDALNSIGLEWQPTR
jgi:hypothetical protein